MTKRRSSSTRDASAPAEPPAGDPWDRPLEEAAFCFVDLEMTGLDPQRDRVVQVCIERVVGSQVVDGLTSYVNPIGAREDGGGERIHGIGPELTATAPAFGDLADRVASLLDGAVFVAHAAKWDVAFLEAAFQRASTPWRCFHYVDTLALSRRAFHLPSHRLHALAESLSIPNDAPHRADNDVRVMREVFERVVERLRPATPRSLWALGAKRHPVRQEILDAAEAARVSRAPILVTYRASGKKPKALQFRVTSIRSDLDPPVVLGYLHQSRGRRQLRADRILAIEPLDRSS